MRMEGQEESENVEAPVQRLRRLVSSGLIG
jgi:hypothetical protein